MELKSINQNTKEGRLLMAAIAVLTTSKSINILGQEVDGTMCTPDTVLNSLKNLDDKIQADKPKVLAKLEDDFKAAALPLIQYLAENHHPHVTAIITNTGGHLLEGITTTGEILDFIKD